VVFFDEKGSAFGDMHVHVGDFGRHFVSNSHSFTIIKTSRLNTYACYLNWLHMTLNCIKGITVVIDDRKQSVLYYTYSS